MKLILLYGPPATGKLTVAETISSKTGIPVFHNHATRDLVHAIFPDTLSENYQLVTDLRNNVFAYCAKHDQDLLFTWVYDGKTDDEVLALMVSAVVNNGGTVAFIELTAPLEVLKSRVNLESRHKHKKLKDPEVLAHLFDEHSFGTVHYDNVIKIDTSTVTPDESADHIISRLGL